MTLDSRTGTATVVREFPPEEQLESAAARVRPITLESDPVFYNKTLSALGTLLTEAGTYESYRDMIKQLRRSWKACTASTAPPTALTQHTGANGETNTADDRTLARAWLYGDVVHADPEHLESTRDFGVEDRYIAAVPFIAQIIRHTLLTLDLIRHTITNGAVELPDALFEGEVIVHGTRTENEARVMTADVGTPMPTDATTPLPAQWRAVQPSDLLPAPQGVRVDADNLDHAERAPG